MRPKDNPIRDKSYRKRVAELRCIACGIEGQSQAAHGPTLGRGIKCSDLDTFLLCADSPGRIGCHRRFDQYDRPAEDRRAQADKWAEQTRQTLKGLI
jgi:hypothetical protein